MSFSKSVLITPGVSRSDPFQRLPDSKVEFMQTTNISRPARMIKGFQIRRKSVVRRSDFKTVTENVESSDEECAFNGRKSVAFSFNIATAPKADKPSKYSRLTSVVPSKALSEESSPNGEDSSDLNLILNPVMESNWLFKQV